MQGSLSYLLNVWLQGAVERPGLHMLGDQAQLPEDMQGQTFFHWAQVWVQDPASLCSREKTKKMPGLSKQGMVGLPGGLRKPLTPSLDTLLMLRSHSLQGKPHSPLAPALKSRFLIAIISTKPRL